MLKKNSKQTLACIVDAEEAAVLVDRPACADHVCLPPDHAGQIHSSIHP